jgi:hypothetical protein
MLCDECGTTLQDDECPLCGVVNDVGSDEPSTDDVMEIQEDTNAPSSQ